MDTPMESDMPGRKSQTDMSKRSGEEDRHNQKYIDNEKTFETLKNDLQYFKQKQQNPTTSQIQRMWKNINRACSENVN